MARICVAGVGAVGTTLAARLHAADHTVNLLARGQRLAQLRQDGLRAKFADLDVEARLNASDRPDFGIQDIVFVATKAQGLAALLPTLGPLIGPHTLVAPLVNGIPWWYFHRTGGPFEADAVHAVDPTRICRDAIAMDHIIGCVVYLTARMLPSGLVTVMGGQRLAVGELSHMASDRASAMAALLSDAGIVANANERIRDDVWTKVALNLATNPLSVVTETTLLKQFTDPTLLPIVSAVLQETSRVAGAHGAKLAMSLDELLATGRRAGEFETSMLQDYRAGRPLELNAIGYSVLELAAKIGQDMPTSKLMIELAAYRAGTRETKIL